MIKTASKKTIAFYTFGCRLNQAETTIIRNGLEKDGYEVVDYRTPADIVVINTCTVTENGDADTRRLVNKVRRVNPKSRIALVGCQAQVQKEQLLNLPNVRWVVGNAKKFELSAIFKDADTCKEPAVITPTIPRDSFELPFAGIDDMRTRANLKIQDGCDFFCSFCEIPYARGRARSRLFSDLLKEAAALVKSGHKELVLTGINVGTYRNSKKNIVDVVDALEQIEGLKRIRISSIEPTTIPRVLIDKMAGDSKLCRYLHIPLQSGDDAVLKRMKRKYSVAEFSNFIKEVSGKVKGICIGTDVIVGFPGETEERFNNTREVLQNLPVHYFHVFSYSNRQMAKSRQLDGELPVNIIQNRSRILRDLSQRKRRMFYQNFVNQTLNVLFEDQKDGYWRGVTENYIRVKVKSHSDLSNRLARVTLSQIAGQSILGRIEKFLSS